MSDPVAQRGDQPSALLTLRIMHAAMIASIAVYGLVLLTVTRSGPAGDPVPASEIELSAPRGEPPGPIFTAVLAVMAAITIAAVFIIRARKLPRTGGGRPALFDEGAGAGAAAGAGSAARPKKKSTRTEYFTLCILCWAMVESIAVYGLVLGFLHHAILPFVPFAAASLLVMVILAPRRSHMDAVAASDAAP